MVIKMEPKNMEDGLFLLEEFAVFIIISATELLQMKSFHEALNEYYKDMCLFQIGERNKAGVNW